MPTKKLLKTLCLLASTLVLVACGEIYTADDAPQIIAGSIDLQGHDFVTDGAVALTGDWEFNEGRYLSPAQLDSVANPQHRQIPANFGIAGNRHTLRLKIDLDPSDQYLGLLMSVGPSVASRYFWNGSEIYNLGNVDSTAEETEFLEHAFVITVPVAPGENELLIHVAGIEGHSAAVWEAPVLGDRQMLFTSHRSTLAGEYFAIGGLFIFAMFQLILYLSRPKDFAPIFLALYCIAMAVWLASTGTEIFNQLFSSVDWRFRFKLEYASAFSAPALLFLSLVSMYKLEYWRWLKPAIVGATLLLLMTIIVLPSPYAALTPIYFVPIFLLSASALVGLTIEAVRSKKEQASLLFVGLIIMVTTGTHDVLKANLDLPFDLPYISAFGVLVFAIFQTLAYTLVSGRIYNRKQIDQRVVQNEQRIRTLLDTATSGIITIDEKGIVESFNPAAGNMFGYEEDEVIGLNVKVLMPEPFHSEHDLHLRNYSETGLAKIIGKTRDVEGLRKDGSCFPMELSVSKIDIGKQKLFSAIIQDVSELKNKRESFQKLFDNNLMPMLVRTAEPNEFIKVNSAACDLFGLTEDQLLNTNPFSVYYEPEDRGKIVNSLDENGECDGVEIRLKEFESGACIDALITASTIIYENTPALLVTALNITERKQAEAEMQQQAALVKLLRETASDANRASNFKEAIQTCLTTVCQFTGWPAGHAYILSDEDDGVLVSSNIWHLETPKRFVEFVKATEKATFETGIGLPGRVLESGEPAWVFDVTKDPNFPRAKIAANINVRGAFALPVLVKYKVVGVLEFFDDKPAEPDESLLNTVAHIGGQLGRVFERNQAEESLRISTAEAEAATQSKAVFLASMSHEIRTPMNGVIGMVDLLRQTELAGEQKKMLETISDSGRSLLSIINDILDFSKIEAGKMDLEQISFSVLSVVEGSVQTIATDAIKKGLRLVTYIDPKLPPFVIGDQVRIRQIIINLGGNAIKFTKEGSVVIRAEQVENSDSQKICIRFSVIDQGIGLSEEGQAKLFQAYSQAETTTSREFGGTGLGLTICKTLTQLMDGEIGVNSKLGEGAEFFTTIPFGVSDKQEEQLTTTDFLGLRVMLVASDHTENKILQHYLEHWKAETDTADCLQSAIKICRTASHDDSPFDVVVLGPQWALKEVLSVAEEAFSTGLKTRFVFCVNSGEQLSQENMKKGVFVRVNPLLRASFISAVAIAAGRESPEVHYEDEIEDLKSTVKALSDEDAREQGTLILVAEDNETNRDIIGRQLSLLGYTCEMAEDGEIALAAWRSNNYGILLTDCNMPNMDGFELTNAIRKDEEGTDNHSKIIAITANALQGEAERCLENGMDDYMSKPIDMKELREKLQKWMPSESDVTNK